MDHQILCGWNANRILPISSRIKQNWDSLKVNLHCRTHGALDIENLDVLPVLFQQWNQKVDCKLNVQLQLFGGHGNVSNSSVQAQHFLHLELDCGSCSLYFFRKRVRVSYKCREPSDLVQCRPQQSGNLFDEWVRGQQSIIFLCPLFDQLFVFVESFESLYINCFNS